MPPSTQEEAFDQDILDARALAAANEVTPKPWGREILWARTPVYAAKLLEIRAGQRLSLQHHECKEETIRVLHGTLKLSLEGDDGAVHERILLPGDCAHILPGRRHRFEAVDFVLMVEVSTSELKDVVRHEDDYGRVG